MKSCQFDSPGHTVEQRYHRMYNHAPSCVVLADRTASTAIILEAHRRAGTSFPTRIIATLDPIGSDPMLVMVEGITIEQARASEAESINTQRLLMVHEIHASEVYHACC